MVRPRKPPSQTWQIFLENHVQNLVSVDFFVVPTIRFQVLYVFLCWLMIGVAFCILGSLLIPRQNGPPSNSGKHFLGTVRLAIYSGIAIGSLAKASGSKSKLWASRKSPRHHGPPGSERTWNG
jgi:hypothetical protein